LISWEDLKIVWSCWPIFCLKEICLKKFMVPHYPLFYDEKSFRALYSLDKQNFDCVKNSNLLDGNVWIANCLLTLATIVRICLPKYKISALKSIFILLWKWHVKNVYLTKIKNKTRLFELKSAQCLTELKRFIL
jgi:hypothetical protein